jgi:hypothetical protein
MTGGSRAHGGPPSMEHRGRLVRTPEPGRVLPAYDASPTMGGGGGSRGADMSPGAASSSSSSTGTTVRGPPPFSPLPPPPPAMPASGVLTRSPGAMELGAGAGPAMAGEMVGDVAMAGVEDEGERASEDEASKRKRERSGLASKASIACSFCRRECVCIQRGERRETKKRGCIVPIFRIFLVVFSQSPLPLYLLRFFLLVNVQADVLLFLSFFFHPFPSLDSRLMTFTSSAKLPFVRTLPTRSTHRPHKNAS